MNDSRPATCDGARPKCCARTVTRGPLPVSLSVLSPGRPLGLLGPVIYIEGEIVLVDLG
jgi:hypothetical protein